MFKTFHLPVAFLFAFPILINFSFSYKGKKVPTSIISTTSFADSTNTNEDVTKEVVKAEADEYTLMDLAKSGLSKEAFELALKGYNNLLRKRMIRNKNVITVVDFSKPSDQKRFFVIDLKRKKLMFESLVAHGRNSGLEYATSFSNDIDSHKSSLGFYVTLKTYSGDHGYALKLKGCEKGFNDHAYERDIVVHGSKYVTSDFLHSNGFLGRSFGCPALPEKMTKKIIDVIKNGSCLFLYHPTKKYLLTSPLLNG
jgi:hypothetical protein